MESAADVELFLDCKVDFADPPRFTISEEANFQVKDRDPAAALGKYGEVEKFARKIDDPEHPENLSNYDLLPAVVQSRRRMRTLAGG